MITVENQNNVIFVFGRSKTSHELHTYEVYDFKPYFYAKDENGSYSSIFGEKCKKVFVSVPSDVPKIRDNYEHMEADIVYTNRFIIDRYDIIEKDPIRKMYIDIEIDSEGEFPSIGSANIPITCITAFDSFEDKFHTFMLGSSNTNDNLYEIEFFNSEVELLKSFLQLISRNDPDMLIAWYGDQFDFPYLINRMQRLHIDYKQFGRMHKAFTILENRKWNTKMFGRVVFDLMYAYKKITQNLRESYSLEYVSNYELGEGKEKFSE